METLMEGDGHRFPGGQETLKYHLYCAAEKLSAEALLDKVRRVAHESAANHLWHCDALRFEKGSSEEVTGFNHIYGFLWFGPNIDDEWHAVKVLYILTERIPGLIAQIIDLDDGELLLIESADHLPSWIESHNGDGRAFVCLGALHIVPRSIDTSNLRGCLEAVLHTEVTTRAEDESQAQIKRRFDPADTNILAGNAILPEPTAMVLSKYPSMMSFAVAGMKIMSNGVPSVRERQLSGKSVRCGVKMTALQVVEFHESLNEDIARRLRDGDASEQEFEKVLGLWIHAAMENAFSVASDPHTGEDLSLQFRDRFLSNSKAQCMAALVDTSTELMPPNDSDKALYNQFKAGSSEQSFVRPEQLIAEATAGLKDFFASESGIEGVHGESEQLHVDFEAVSAAVADALGYEEGPFKQDKREDSADDEASSEDETFNLNVDAEAIDNILRSVNAQTGSSGPAGNLLSSMGINVKDLMHALNENAGGSKMLDEQLD
mmetsp:Transcript_8473/g.25455  ORF Transcript_8473/g.25455 Transcript_8473/m.25455 type:complete len:490 (+) Transcript_8473:124-1593(+)